MSTNPWIQHVKRTRSARPELSYKEALQEAKKTYKKSSQKGQGPEHARFAADVYKKPSERKDVKNYVYVGGDDEKGVWSGPDIIIAYRGTTTKQDVKDDVKLAAGFLRKTARYKRDLDFAKAILKKATKPVIITGHSLGGAIATEIGRELHLKTWAYNAGMSVKEKVRAKTDKLACLAKPKGKKCQKAKLISNERTFGDPVSLLGKNTMQTKHIIPKKFNIHSIDNFEQLKD